MAIKCLSSEVRDVLVEVLEEFEVEADKIQILKDMPACANAPIEYETPSSHTPEHTSKRESGTPRSKRPPSAYQQHTSECMKGGKHTMSECAAEWRAKKGK
jgi:hypothetical protein